MSEAPKKPSAKSAAASSSGVISASGFVLKGGGWYKDLYSRKPGSGDKE